jgi:hypothetical protein
MVVAIEELKVELVALTERERADLAVFLLHSLKEANTECDIDVEGSGTWSLLGAPTRSEMAVPQAYPLIR